MPARDRALRIDGLVNARDLGGMPRIGGPATPFGVFARSESVDRIPRAGWDRLFAAGFRSVVDLRQRVERDRDTGVRPAWLTTLEVDHDGRDDESFWGPYWESGLVGTALYYLPHLEAMPERTVAVLRALVGAPPGGVLIHCAGGRDRTGLIAAVLLAAAEVQPEAIVDDYLISVANADALVAATGRPSAEAACEAICRANGTTTEGAFRSALAGLDIGRLLDALTADERTGVVTWRGTLEPARS